MKTAFSKQWKSSRQPRKQRKYAAQAPLHIKGRLLHAHLSKELREKHGTRAVRIKKGDKIKVSRGMFGGKTGTVESVNTKEQRIYASNIEYTKKDGAKTKYPLHVSNVIITGLNLEDKKRKQKLEPKKTKQKDEALKND